MLRFLGNMGSALHHVAVSMSPSRWNDFFARLNEPERITVEWIRGNRTLTMQLSLLIGTVSTVEKQYPDPHRLLPDAVANNFDRAIFSIGQLCAHEPAEMSRHEVAPELVRALGIGLKYGWSARTSSRRTTRRSCATTARCLCAPAGQPRRSSR